MAFFAPQMIFGAVEFQSVFKPAVDINTDYQSSLRERTDNWLSTSETSGGLRGTGFPGWIDPGDTEPTDPTTPGSVGAGWSLLMLLSAGYAIARHRLKMRKIYILIY